MHFPDLSEYTYFYKGRFADVVNVGWLDPEHPFTRGPVPEQALIRLLEFCATRAHVTRGFHRSPFDATFDTRHNWGYPVEVAAGETLLLGSAEVWVHSNEGRVYAAPNLIYHYVRDVGYQPPEEYIRALLDPKSRAISDAELDLPNP